ncbi:MAG: Gfo/Idh/MocA family oxidoreductase, partial [Lentisphaerae bacterium]|nr:Gfo/Idh/MocA family oxidoreductase [Lentisphaerota bacterium]
MKTGLIGCGNISGAYLSNGSRFKQMKIVACADMVPEVAKAKAEEFGLKAMSVDELLADPSIDTVLNLTTPASHSEINTRALEAGKNVHCEKPFGLDREEARKVIELAKAKNLRVGSAPDTFLGGGHQMCRKLIDEGYIGDVVNGTAFMLCHGHESWHPAPAFYYLKGGGPLFDMGPYYITALVNLLGPVEKATAMANRSTDLRIGIKSNVGQTFPVEIDTHISAVLKFKSGAVITLITSFDVWKHSDLRDIELHGTDGSMHVPDPNCFDGDIRVYKAGLTSNWAPVDNSFIYNDNMRGIG